MWNIPKTNISYPLIRGHACAYQGVRNVSFSEDSADVLNEWYLFKWAYTHIRIYMISDMHTYVVAEISTIISFNFIGIIAFDFVYGKPWYNIANEQNKRNVALQLKL